MTFEDHIAQLREEGKRTGKDVAYATLWRRDKDPAISNIPVECKVIWLDPGKYPAQFPDQGGTAPGEFWDQRWTIIRCAPQPTPQVISLVPGKFLPEMPDIKLH